MFSFAKMMKCFICVNTFSIAEESFPEDLYDLILRYKTDQLLWVCKSCKKDSNLTPSVSLLSDVLKKILTQLDKINYEIGNLTKEVRNGCRQVDPAFPLGYMIQHRTIKSDDVKSIYECHGDQHDAKGMHPYRDLKVEPPNLVGPFKEFGSARDSQRTSQSPPSSPRVEQNLNDSGSDSGSPRRRQRSQSPPHSSPKECLPYIHSILNDIKISKEDEKSSNKIVKEVLEEILSSLKKDKEFESLFNKPYYTGSSYSGLRITSASEYDIDLVLKMPSLINLKPEFFDSTKTFGKLKVNGLKDTGDSKFLQCCSSDGYLQPFKVLSWLQSLVDVMLRKTVIKINNVKCVKCSQSGPARTVVIETDLQSAPRISIDLVPVFEFDDTFLSDTPILSELQKITDDISKYKWFMVPKPVKDEVDLTVSDAKYSWRLDFPDIEKAVIHDKECAKPIIKILKLLRDKQNWKQLASYYLKTVVMLKLLDSPSKVLWSGSHLFYRFLEALGDLKTHLENQSLPHIVTKQNLFHKIAPCQCKEWSIYLQKMIVDVETDPKNLEKYFK